MKNVTPSEIIANKCVGEKLRNIIDCLELLTSGWGNDLFTSEATTINYYTLLKETFVNLNYLLINHNDDLNKNINFDLININSYRHGNISKIDAMFLDQYFDILNGEPWAYSSLQLTGTQDCKKYYGTPYMSKHTNFLTIRDAYLNCVKNIDTPLLVSILKTLIMVHIISNDIWFRQPIDNVPKVSIV